MGGAELQGRLLFEFHRIDGNDLRGAADAGALDRARSDSADADHHDGVAHPHTGAVGDRSKPGRNRAGQQRDGRQRQVRLDLDEGIRRHHSVFRECSHFGDVTKRFAVGGVMAEGAVGRHAGRHDAGPHVADVLHTARTPAALSAHRDERHHYVVTRREFGYAVADFAYRSRALVATDGREHGGQPEFPQHLVGRRHVAFEDVVVGVAQSGGGHLDQNFAGPRWIQLELLDGPRAADVVQDGCAALHATGVKVTGSLLGERKVRPTILASSPVPSSGTNARSVTRSSKLFNITWVSSRARCIPRHM